MACHFFPTTQLHTIENSLIHTVPLKRASCLSLITPVFLASAVLLKTSHLPAHLPFMRLSCAKTAVCPLPDHFTAA